MKKEDIDLAKQEFYRDRDLWTNLLNQRRSYYSDLLTRVADRQINHILVLTTIAVAVLSIVFPVASKTSYLSIASFMLLAASVLLGTGLVLYSVFRDKIGLPKMRDEELGMYRRFQKAAIDNLTKSYSGSLTTEDVAKYFDLRDKVLRELGEKKENRTVEAITAGIYLVFLISFSWDCWFSYFLNSLDGDLVESKFC